MGGGQGGQAGGASPRLPVSGAVPSGSVCMMMTLPGTVHRNTKIVEQKLGGRVLVCCATNIQIQNNYMIPETQSLLLDVGVGR